LAATRCQLRLIPSDELLAVVDDVPAARRHVLAYLARHLRDQQDDLVRTNFADAAGRVAAWLARAACDGDSRITLPGAQQGLAEAVGMTRVSVNRALGQLTP
jgi:CRP/FNR family transcriptional regulator